MKRYTEIGIESANRLINHGPVVLVSTKDKKGLYDTAPVAWTSPVAKSPPMLLIVVGKKHKTYENIAESKEFIVCVPHISQVQLVLKTGSVSGKDVDKFDSLNITSFAGKKVDALIVEGCVGYIECKMVKIIETEDAGIIIGQVLLAAADEQAYSERLVCEKQAGKTLHHLGGNAFAVPGDEIIGT